MPDPTRPPGSPLPPPAPGPPVVDPPPLPGLTPNTFERHLPRRTPRVGELTAAWRTATVVMWGAVVLAYLAVWKTSEELGLATWWLGPRSDPQPVLVRLVPFLVAAFFGILASYYTRRLPLIGMIGAVILAGIAVPDLSRSAGLATIEFAIAAAVLLVSLASLTGLHRAPSPNHAR